MKYNHAKFIYFGNNRKYVHEFPIVIKDNLGPVLHRLRDRHCTSTFQGQNCNFFRPSFITPPPLLLVRARGEPFRISGWIIFDKS